MMPGAVVVDGIGNGGVNVIVAKFAENWVVIRVYRVAKVMMNFVRCCNN